VTEDSVSSLLEKLHRFSTTELDLDERAVLGALLAPGIRWALGQGAADDEVTSFGLLVWTPESLANGLRRALADRAGAEPAGGTTPSAP